MKGRAAGSIDGDGQRKGAGGVKFVADHPCWAEGKASQSYEKRMLMAQSEVKCYCCGLTEECTPAYVATVKERHQDRWICGLCAEAIKDENSRSSRKISTEEAMKRHVSFCEEFRMSSPPAKPTDYLISAMKQLLRRTKDSQRRNEKEDKLEFGPVMA
ncbi:hypothetical protein EV2_023542 [Malus domestica]